MFKLFDSIPFQFFQVLASPNRELYANILFWIYFECKNENSYTLPKEEFISLIENYFNEYTNETIEEDGKELKASRDKANWIFRKLKYYGWIDTEFIANGEQVVNLEDYAIVFLNAYVGYERESDLELSSHVYHIYNNLKTMDYERSYFVLRDTLSQVRDLIQKLRSLNSNIKKYIKKITKLNSKTEEEQLQIILEQLLTDYKVKIVDNAYFYMKTNDNPIKYKSKFIEECQKIHYDEYYRNQVITQITEEDRVDKETATIKFNVIMEELEEAFDRIIDIITEIDTKNTKYINVAIERKRILLNHDKNIEGQLLNILKNIRGIKEEIQFSFYDSRNITLTSLYSPRKLFKIKPTPTIVKTSEEIDLEKIELIKRMKRNKQFSGKAIRNYVDTLLNQKEEVTIKDFNLKENDEFIKLILIFVYSEEKKNNYKIIWGEKEDKIGKYYVPNFKIERKEEI